MIQIKFGEEMKFLNSRLVSGELKINNHKIEIIGVYVPSRNNSDLKILRKKIFLEKLLNVFKNNHCYDERLFCGDLNLLEPNHIPHYSFFREWEYNFYKNVLDHDFLDAFRKLNPKKRDYSWIGKTGDGYRYDHCFVSKKLAKHLYKSFYLHTPRTSKLSDHAALIIELLF